MMIIMSMVLMIKIKIDNEVENNDDCDDDGNVYDRLMVTYFVLQ